MPGNIPKPEESRTICRCPKGYVRGDENRELQPMVDPACPIHGQRGPQDNIVNIPSNGDVDFRPGDYAKLVEWLEKKRDNSWSDVAGNAYDNVGNNILGPPSKNQKNK